MLLYSLVCPRRKSRTTMSESSLPYFLDVIITLACGAGHVFETMAMVREVGGLSRLEGVVHINIGLLGAVYAQLPV